MARKQAVIIGSMAILVGVGLLGPTLFGQNKPGPSPEKLLPAGTLIYFGWDGSDAHREAWKKTAAYDALIQSGLGDVVTKLIAWGERQAGHEPVRMVTGSLDHLLHKGLYVAIAAPPADQGPPLPQLTIVVPEAAPAIKDIAGLLDQFGIRDFHQQEVEGRTVTRGRIPTLPAAEVGWWAEGSHLVIAAGIGAVDAAIRVAAGKAPNLSTNPVAKKYQAPADFEVALVSWIDLGTIRQMTGGFPVPAGDQGGAVQVGEILKTLGLDAVGPLAFRFGMKDQSLWTETILEVPSPRAGVLAFAEQKPITLKDLPPLPAATDGFYAARFDWSQAATGLLKMADVLVKQFGPPGSPTGEQLTGAFQKETGVDLQKGLLDPLGDVMVLYGDPRQGMFGMGLGLAISVDDPPALRAALEKLLARLQQAAGKDVTVQTSQRGGQAVTSLEFPGFPVVSPSLAVTDKWLVVGIYPQTIESFVMRQQGKLPAWEPSAALTQALGELPKTFTSLTYSDPREGLRTALGLAPVLISYAQNALAEQRRRQNGPDAKVDVPIAASDFPPAEAITRSLFANVSVSSVTDKEIRWTSRTSLPAVPLLGGAGIGSGGAGAPVLVALLLPAVQQSRTAARRSQSMNNLKQIGLALHLFHEANNGFPAGTHQNDRLKAEKRLSWMADLLPYLDQNTTYERIDFKKAWDDPANAAAVGAQLPVFLNPGVMVAPDPMYGRTHYVGIAGVGPEAPTLPITDKRAGFFGFNRIAPIRNILDGTSNTMAVSEASKDYGPWSAGGPATIRALTKKPYINGPDGLGGPFPGGMNVLFVDGSVRFVSQNIDPTILEALSTIAGGEIIEGF